jgi:hypothetical protein
MAWFGNIKYPALDLLQEIYIFAVFRGDPILGCFEAEWVEYLSGIYAKV